MQLLDVVHPKGGSTPQLKEDLPLEAQGGYSVIRDSHFNSLDNTPEQYPSNGLRHRCPFKHCSDPRMNTRAPTDCSPDYGTNTHSYQPTSPDVRLNFYDYDRSSSFAAQPNLLPAYPALYRRGLEAPSKQQLSQQDCASATDHYVIPQDYRKRAVLFIIKQLKVEGNQDIHKEQEFQRRIISLESQIYHSTNSQDEYVIKLGSKLTAILQQLEQSRPTPVAAALRQRATV